MTTRPPLRTVALAFATRLVLGRLTRDPDEAADERAAREGAEHASAPPAPRLPLLGLMLGSAALGVPLMVLFEHTLTRVAGVLCIFSFVVSGLFLIADPRLLEHEASEQADRG